MSYILDALRRADAERGRGAVPSIYSQADLPAPAGRAARSRNALLVWAVVALSVALLGMLVWVMRGRTATPTAAESAPLTAQLPSTAPTPPQEAAPAPSPAVAPATTAAAPPAAVPVLPAPAARPAASRQMPAATQSPTLAQTAKPATQPATTTAASRVYAVHELPDDIRRGLPTLAVGGAMYSANAANRMLIINGQLMHEGDKLAPDLVLEQIKLKSAVLRYKNYRYGISY
ncbi:MAG TPA: general secretion pathway protein GspB [Rhizobacter sp.]|nr:general secretion pathway protein GspB [Rhizobacter sp.]